MDPRTATAARLSLNLNYVSGSFTNLDSILNNRAPQNGSATRIVLVPEPASLALVGAGGLLMATRRRKA